MGIADEKYVSLTTYRRTGEAVSSPVWIAALADGTAGFTTDLDSGKVKRIRNNPKVCLRPCTMRGKVAPGAEEVAATATILTDTDMAPVRRAIIKKYGLIGKVIGFGEKIAGVLRGSRPSKTCAISLHID